MGKNKALEAGSGPAFFFGAKPDRFLSILADMKTRGADLQSDRAKKDEVYMAGQVPPKNEALIEEV